MDAEAPVIQAHLQVLRCVLQISPAAQAIAVCSMQRPESEPASPASAESSAQQIR